MKLEALAVALIGSALIMPATSKAAAPVDGETKTCRVKIGGGNCPGDHIDPVGTTYVEYVWPGTKYRSIQWIGMSRSCTSASDPDHDGYCKTTFTVSSSIATAWKVGIKASFAAKIADTATLTAEANAEFGVTKTDTDTLSETRSIPVGYTETVYSYIYRQKYSRYYKGFWRKTGEYNCGFLSLYRCYEYTWDRWADALVVTYQRADGGTEQIFDFKRYTNGSSSGLVLEKDD